MNRTPCRKPSKEFEQIDLFKKRKFSIQRQLQKNIIIYRTYGKAQVILPYDNLGPYIRYISVQP